MPKADNRAAGGHDFSDTIRQMPQHTTMQRTEASGRSVESYVREMAEARRRGLVRRPRALHRSHANTLRL